MFMVPVPSQWMDGVSSKKKSLFVPLNTSPGEKDEAQVVHMLAYDASLMVYKSLLDTIYLYQI